MLRRRHDLKTQVDTARTPSPTHSPEPSEENSGKASEDTFAALLDRLDASNPLRDRQKAAHAFSAALAQEDSRELIEAGIKLFRKRDPAVALTTLGDAKGGTDSLSLSLVLACLTKSVNGFSNLRPSRLSSRAPCEPRKAPSSLFISAAPRARLRLVVLAVWASMTSSSSTRAPSVHSSPVPSPSRMSPATRVYRVPNLRCGLTNAELMDASAAALPRHHY